MDLTDFVFRNVGTGRGSYKITARGLRFVFSNADKRTSFCPPEVDGLVGRLLVWRGLVEQTYPSHHRVSLS